MVDATRGGIGAVGPTLEEFRALAADRRVIPVVRRLLADDETPLGVYRKLADDRPGTFLFESAENGRSWSRWSFIGVNSPAALTVRDGEAVWTGTPPVGLPSGGDPLVALRKTLAELHTDALPGLPPLHGGMVGYLGYDAVRRLERLPELTEDDLGIPEMVMLLATDLAALDHHEGTITLIANAVNWDDSPERVDAAYQDALRRLDEMTARLAVSAPSSVAVYQRPQPDFVRRRSEAEHHEAVLSAKEAIRAGEAFQVVVSQRFEMTTGADALDVYRVLRATNPSPYMYLLRLESPGADGEMVPFDIVGSSPESLVTVRDGQATTHPIAGTRWRGADAEEDIVLEKDLLADEKERAEHLMLVDLGRNDLGRVCEPGSVSVVEFFTVERYSHVMHIVSTVTGRLAPGRTAFDAITACFPAGTLSGAPKPRAMELIEELEPTRRGLYGGVVGYLDFAGDADTAIAIRTALMRAGTAYVQAGGGIVADSDPVAEDNECLNKAGAVLAAIAMAGTMAEPAPAGTARTDVVAARGPDE
ncbi:anthranilate synthase component I [Actinoalloteichus hymeniacidonis]|uniref:Anthranilate synthase component 1 n=1 Tax=Actinoalloteichus hymeniacidonis TaxID=340345 RepID=A0AAC9HP38_9PSEU|nr:anthranilate synthase component I [Actinoalloteichus hymeniacidonis]AOS62768.1 anthranilate synthase component I [Actinoalloteichus hymeniacidonis]MBB5909201.1 anthranilate synthase component 1 [Actinoalloteichus hymeniacidonis]